VNYTGCTQCATPKLPKKVLHIGDIVAHWGHCPGKMRFFEKILVLDFLIFGLFFPIRKNQKTKNARKKSQFDNQEDVPPNPIQEIQCEEADSEPIVKKTRQLSILDFCKK